MGIADQIEALQNNEQIAEKLEQFERLSAIRKQCADLMGDNIGVKKGYNLAPVNVLGVIYPHQTTFKIFI